MTTLQPESDAVRDLRRLCDKYNLDFASALAREKGTPEENAIEAYRRVLSARYGVEVSTEGAADSLALSKELEANNVSK